MTQHYHGYSGNSYDRWVEKNSNSSTFGKVQKQFWFTKSAVLRKFGKHEDEYIVASDAELDAKIDLFKAIESSTRELQILLADYQNRVCILAQEENALGRLLKEFGKQDQTRAGRMMLAVGKSLSYTAQQRVALRNPLVRLFQEVDTFQSRAVEDTSHTVEEMEKVRTEYRGALMWMKNISQDFNPDHYQQLEKFREVQTLVKQKKCKFDQIKIKSLQKIELLATSRCNMFSHALILYQNNLITFSEKTAKTLNSVAANFKGYQPYKFHVIKELAEPEALMEKEEDKQEADLEGDDKCFFDSEYRDEDKLQKEESKSSTCINNRANKYKKKEEKKLGKNSDSLVNLFNSEEADQLISFDNENSSSADTKSGTTDFANVDLLSEAPALDEANTNTMDILKDLFDSPAHAPPQQFLPIYGTGIEDDMKEGHNYNSLGKDVFSNKVPQMFMPSHLLDFGFQKFESQQSSAKPSNPSSFTTTKESQTIKDSTNSIPANQSIVPLQAINTLSTGPSQFEAKDAHRNTKTQPSQESKQQSSKLDWYKVFQDIDPLSDPGNAIFGKGFINKKC